MGFAALGGLANVIISMPPTHNAWEEGGILILSGIVIFIISIFCSIYLWKKLNIDKKKKYVITTIIIATSYFLMRYIIDIPIQTIESIEPARTGYLGGFDLPVIISWPIGGLLAALTAYAIGKIALGLRSDYLAIATLGISEIIIYVLKNEDWLSRGVKNVNGLPRPVPYEIELQSKQWVIEIAQFTNVTLPEISSIIVKLSYSFLFIIILIGILILLEIALKSPWGRMMRAIRDNEVSANAMGKDIKKRHLQVFIIGSAIIGIAGAMLTTLDGQFTPLGYQPLRFTFLIWVMVIIGGSGNNWGAVLGGFFIWFFWIEAEPIGLWLIEALTSFMDKGHWLRASLIENAAHMRLATVGIILLFALRYFPDGLLPEQKASGETRNRNSTGMS